MKKLITRLSLFALIFGLIGFLPIQKALAQTIHYNPQTNVEFEITNSLSSSAIYAGNNVTMTYNLHNIGLDNLVTAHAVLTFPTALNYVSCGTYTCSYNAGNRQLTLNFGDLITSGQTVTGSFSFQAQSAGTSNIDATLAGDSGRAPNIAWQVTAEYPVTVLAVAATPTALPATGADLQPAHYNFAEILARVFFPPATIWFKI